MKHRTSKGGAAAPRNRTSAARGRSAFVLQSDEVRRRSGEGPPALPVRVVTVRPLNGALVYTDTGFPLPEDQWSQVPVSPGVIMALKYGDLEEGEEVTLPAEGEGRRNQPETGSSAKERAARRENARSNEPPSVQ